MLARKDETAPKMGRARYSPPPETHVIQLSEVFQSFRPIPASQGSRLMLPGFDPLPVKDRGPALYYAGDISLLAKKCIAVVGSRKVSEAGKRRAKRLVEELVAAGTVIVSGLAAGVDSVAHSSALAANGRTVAVIGTPLTQSYPIENAALQEQIYREHLLLSPFAAGTQVFPSNFPTRNKFMAAISDGTVIIEASDTSGTLHQARECAPDRLNRPLFILRSVIDDKTVTWPSRFQTPNVHIVDRVEDIIDHLK